MIKDLTTLKWKKNIYYVSDDIIFEISSKRLKDLDNCATYLIDMDKLPDNIKNAKDGTLYDISKYPEAFIHNVPFIKLTFRGENVDEILFRYFPLQYIVEEGDKVIDGVTVQNHPDIYNNSYINKFNQEVFNYIKPLVKDLFSPKNIANINKALPDWLQECGGMTEKYIDNYFVKGVNYNENIALKGGGPIYQLDSVILGIGNNEYPINIWNNETIQAVEKAIYAEKITNGYNTEVKSYVSSLTKDSMEAIAATFKASEFGYNPDNLHTYPNISYIENDVDIKFESVCAPDDVDTYYEYIKKDMSNYYTLVKDEESYNNCAGLAKYYEWSDRVNKPYKEDLLYTDPETGATRAANINDVRKDPETGELMTDENGNYIYDNCVRCWEGAIKAPGAKFPWMVVDFNNYDVDSAIAFKYSYPDGNVKVVKPWNDKVFKEGSWGVASLATEFNDNDFLIPENRTDGGESTFDINNFELLIAN